MKKSNLVDSEKRNERQSVERGSVMIVAMVTLSGLLAVAALTLVKVKRGMNASSQSRFQSVALFAAESGISSGMEFLRANNATGNFNALLNTTPTGITGNLIEAGQVGSVFTGDVEMSYSVSIVNNRDDAGFNLDPSLDIDQDNTVILHVEGRGPGSSRVVLEVEVRGATGLVGGRPCPGYAQGNITEDGAGRNDCLGTIEFGEVQTFVPGEDDDGASDD